MSAPETQAATVDTFAHERSRPRQRPTATLVFRWGESRALADLPEGAELIVGRSSACDVRIDELSLSRRHARFRFDGGLVRVDDLDSRNGVSARGGRVSTLRLAGGEEVRLGNVRASVIVLVPEQPATRASENAAELEWAGRGMAELRRELEKIAPTPLPVLVLGETGSGKELIARELHRLSPRARSPLQVINCAALPGNLVESTLFGHEKGAFTGADWAQPGAFEQAGDGTLFLDELGELPLAAQAALLRVLESGRFSRVGSTREQESRARIVAATHRDLSAMVEQGSFRLDLLHRLDAVSLRVPPLRERPDAIDPLVSLFLRRAEKRIGTAPRQLSDEAMEALRRYHWPGNVRELRNVIERAVAIADGAVVGRTDLPARVCEGPPEPTAFPTVRGRPSARPTQPAGVAGQTLKQRHEEEERELLIRTLEQTGGSQTEAAVLLGWSLRTLQRRVQKYGLSRSRR